MGTKLFLKNSSNQFLKNSSGSFLYKTLPPEYQEVEYIQSSGTQYIITDAVVGTNFEFVLDQMSAFDSGNHYMAGSGIRGQMIGMLGNHLWTNAVAGGAIPVDSNVRQKLSAKLDLQGSSGSNWKMTNYTKNLTGSGHASYTTSPGSGKVHLFTVNATGIKESFKCYNFKVYNNGSLICNLIPCYRKSDNVIGMYDTVEDKFYTNAGTGTFTKGSDIG